MLRFLATGDEKMLIALQERDHQHQEWHRETEGIDYYACFTIKHQMRKYFQFGPGLDPEYMKIMKRGAKKWTEQDPLRRPHYAHTPGTQGWGPDAKNSWVDVRTTDNLTWMRLSSVYLMAEETGNKKTASIYKDRIQKFVVALYRVGTGEWDSHNYLSHTITPIHNLYDFAKDPEVRLLAKAALDHYYTAAAIKYRKGNWNGPNKRDYNAIDSMTASPAVFSVHFGQNPMIRKPDYDWIHVLASSYRPPMAVLELGRKKDVSGTEFLINHAPYSDPMKGNFNVTPDYFETQFIGDTFQLGTLARGTQEPDANGFKILADDSEKGAEMIQLVPGPDHRFPGSPQYQPEKLFGKGRVAHSRNVAIYLVNGDQTPWTWVIPDKTQVEKKNGVLFLQHENTWIAYRPLKTNIEAENAEKTDMIKYRNRRVRLKKDQIENPPEWLVPGSMKEDDKGRTWAQRRTEYYPEYKVLTATADGKGWAGFVVEIGEPSTHGSYQKFQSAILSKASLEDSKLGQGLVTYSDSLGKQQIEIRAEEALSGSPVLINGTVRNWKAPFVKYAVTDASGQTRVEQSWTGDTLTVNAGGHTFTSQVKEDGSVRFENR